MPLQTMAKTEVEIDKDIRPIDILVSSFEHPSFQYLSNFCILLIGILFRLAVSLGPYSGFNKPPMYGDFEAQRHWMEITINLPLQEWYNYKLEYWGLDYPPLSAYLAWFFGRFAKAINPNWITLVASEGFESHSLKYFMRFTVLFCDIALLLPGILYYCRYWRIRKHLNIKQYTSAAALMVLNPCFIIIDHGHFQYNTVMLGLSLSTMCNIMDRNFALAAIVFSSAVLFKQMALYYAPSFMCFLIAILLKQPNGAFFKILRIVIATFSIMLLILLPFFYITGFSGILQILKRVFPFERGLWEDKVANVWCVTNSIIKLKNVYTLKELRNMSLITTLIAILPTCLYTIIIPSRRLLPYSVAACSLSFYLFSFQVHEKSILLPCLPMSLLLISNDRTTREWSRYFSVFSMYSLWPLIKREDLQLQFTALLICWFFLSRSYGSKSSNTSINYLFVSTYFIAFFIWICDIFFNAPKTKPDLFVLLNCTISFMAFFFTLVWLNYTILNKKMLHEP